MEKSISHNGLDNKYNEGMNNKKKVLMIAYLPSPYWVDFLNVFSKYIDLTVLFENKESNERKKSWLNNNFLNFKGVFLPSNKITRFEMIRKYCSMDFDLLWNCDYSKLECIVATLFFKLKRRPVLLHADGGVIVPRFIDPLISFIMKQSTFYASSGKECDKYFRHYKINQNRIFNYRFTSLSKSDVEANLKYKNDNRDLLRKQMGLAESFVVISVGRQIYEKGYDVLLKAAAMCNKNIKIFIIGGKPTELNKKIKEQYHLDNIKFIDFLPFDEVRKYYAISDLFVMPTRSDVWGLVINEAISFGLPLIVSNKCSGGVEIVNKFNNGYIVNVDDVNGLAELIKLLMNNKQKYGYNILSIKAAFDYTLENMVKDYQLIFEEIFNRF